MADRLKDKKTRANQRKNQRSSWISTLNETKKRKATGDVKPFTPSPVIKSRIFVFHADRMMEWK
jgi:hypothetical protein